MCTAVMLPFFEFSVWVGKQIMLLHQHSQSTHLQAWLHAGLSPEFLSHFWTDIREVDIYRRIMYFVWMVAHVGRCVEAVILPVWGVIGMFKIQPKLLMGMPAGTCSVWRSEVCLLMTAVRLHSGFITWGWGSGSIAYTYILPSWFKALLLSLPYIVYSSSPLYFLSKSSILPPIVPKVLLHCAKIQKFAFAQFSQISTRADYLNPLTSFRKIKMFSKVIDSSLKPYSWKMSSMCIVLCCIIHPIPYLDDMTRSRAAQRSQKMLLVSSVLTDLRRRNLQLKFLVVQLAFSYQNKNSSQKLWIGFC